jgi:hypothetical protein
MLSDALRASPRLNALRGPKYGSRMKGLVAILVVGVVWLGWAWNGARNEKFDLVRQVADLDREVFDLELAQSEAESEAIAVENQLDKAK